MPQRAVVSFAVIWTKNNALEGFKYLMMLPDKSQRITKVTKICHEGNITVYAK